MKKGFDKQKRSISGKRERVNYVSFYSFWSTLLCNYFGQVTYIVILFSFFFFFNIFYIQANDEVFTLNIATEHRRYVFHLFMF